MIDFEEELKKYEPAIEVEQAEADIKARDLTDLTDLLFNMTAQNNGTKLFSSWWRIINAVFYVWCRSW